LFKDCSILTDLGAASWLARPHLFFSMVILAD